MSSSLAPTNFAHLQEHSPQLLRLGMLAEKYFADDPNTCLLKLRQLAELLAQTVAAKVGLFVSTEEAQYELLRRLQDEDILPREVAQLFGEIRRSGNSANHALVDDQRTALANLKLAWQISLWFHCTFQNPAFNSPPPSSTKPSKANSSPKNPPQLCSPRFNLFPQNPRPIDDRFLKH
jgi:type I restriction enzyme, R subunit